MKVLVLNSGSSSVKFQVIETDAERIRTDSDRRLARGLLERIGGSGSIALEAAGRTPLHIEAALPDHRAALGHILRWLAGPDSGPEGIRSAADLHAVGHRVVHGGEAFRASVRVDPDVMRGIEACVELAPLHNPANIAGIRAVGELLGPAIPQVAVFDTAFHGTMPAVASFYGIPYELQVRHRIRRYGFHGTSHRFVSERYCDLRGVSQQGVRLVTLHLGNGCSACAIRDGRSVDTSMGFTPLEGLLMGTRCGDLDASVVGYLAERERTTPNAIESLLNERSGLLGLSGRSRDMRDLLEAESAGDERARLAIDVFCYRARKYVGAYFAALGGADAVIFTGGIGENSPVVRQRICAGLESIGLVLDAERNTGAVGGRAGPVSEAGSPLAAWVIPTDEELLIARDTFNVVSGGGGHQRR